MLSPEIARFDPTVDVLMTPRPITIDPSSTVGRAAALMKSCRVRHLPVVKGTLVGVISLRDVIAADESAIVGHVMTREPQVASASTTLSSACEQMLGGRYSSLPVVDDQRHLVGIFTATDALRFASTVLAEDARAQGHAPQVSHVMTARPLVTVEPSTPLAQAWQLMSMSGVRHLPVVRDGELVAMLTDRDVLAAGREWLDQGASARQPAIVVADAMTDRIAISEPDRPAIEAATTLLRRRLGALAVMRGRELLGIVTVTDFLYWILARV